jgi:polar amino acid transport system substrate-binding protein
MRHTVRIFIFIILMLFSANAYSGEVMTASGHPEYPPVMWKQGDEIIGVGPELMKLVFKPLGVTAKCPYRGDWYTVQDELKNSKIDALVGIYMTDERKAIMDFSIPFTKDPVVIFVAKGKTFPFEKREDLIGKKGVSTTGDSFGQAFDAFISAKLDVKRSVTVKENFDKLLSGQADYFIFAMYSGNFEAKKLGMADKIEHLKKEASVENFYFAVSKKSRFAPLIPKANKCIEKLLKDGTVDRLVIKYTRIYEDSLSNKN